ncbi:MAG: hypothetical protein OEQ53_12545 [Saprospiraceae bacterium]|nr:hypothetical protein [Saprospiraceae bacterium]
MFSSKNRSFVDFSHAMTQKYCIKIIFVLLMVGSCTKDTVPEPPICMTVPTFDQSVREIIRNRCNFSGCHDGSSGVGNYNSYSGLDRVLQSGKFKQLVIIEKTMPRSGTLNDAEFESLRCWTENGFLEN